MFLFLSLFLKLLNVKEGVGLAPSREGPRDGSSIKADERPDAGGLRENKKKKVLFGEAHKICFFIFYHPQKASLLGWCPKFFNWY